MTPQILEKDHAAAFPASPDSHAQQDGDNPRGGAFRGLMYAMLFNVFLIAVAAGIWELWRVLAR